MPRVPDAFDTASIWSASVGLGLRAFGHPRSGGLLLLAPGIGYFGGVWERACGMRLSALRTASPKHIDLSQFLYHAAMVVYGLELLSR